MTRDQYLLQTTEIIEKHGWAVQGVFGTEENPSPNFCYTAGLTEKDLPELLMCGLPIPVMQHALNHLAGEAVAGRLVLVHDAEEHGVLGINGEFGVRLHGPISPELGGLSVARVLYLEPRAMQVLWPDFQHHFPGDPGYDSRFDQIQPILPVIEETP